MLEQPKFIGIDLFAGAGGLSLGAEMAGIDVKIAVESDVFAAKTYKVNHPTTLVLNKDIKTIDNDLKENLLDCSNNNLILFGGPPCQGFSTSNQKTRNKQNPQNWLFEEFIRVASELRPQWLVLENVKGIRETEKGFFEKRITQKLIELGYTCTSMILCASDYGVPQKRSRFFLIGSLQGREVGIPSPMFSVITVREAIEDLPSLVNGANENILPYKIEAKSDYARRLRNGLDSCTGHLVTKNTDIVIKRYSFIPQGGNWQDIPDDLMTNYKDRTRCHTAIYHRLSENNVSVTVGNYRKSMLIHPWENRGLSVREAARLQSFPDWYKFSGSIGFQQQQVGNAVPPLLAKVVFQAIIDSERFE